MVNKSPSQHTLWYRIYIVPQLRLKALYLQVRLRLLTIHKLTWVEFTQNLGCWCSHSRIEAFLLCTTPSFSALLGECGRAMHMPAWLYSSCSFDLSIVHGLSTTCLAQRAGLCTQELQFSCLGTAWDNRGQPFGQT